MKKKTALKAILAVALALLLIVVGYLLYVVLSYYRVEDNLSLDIEGEASANVPAGVELTVMTYNIGFGAYSNDYSFFMDGGEHARALSKDAVIENTKGAISVLKEHDPDFILLQEVDIDGTRSYHVDQVAMIAENFAEYERIFAQNYDSAYFAYPFNEPIGANLAGMMTLSRYDVTESTRRQLPIEETLYKFLDLDRCYSVSVIPVEGGKLLYLYNVHLSAYTSDGTISDEQLKLLSADMAEKYAAGHYIIAGGDFNKDLLGNSGDYFERIEGEFTWAKPLEVELLPDFITVHTGSNEPTCRNADSPYRADGTDFVLSVDGILVSDNIEVKSAETVSTGFAYSDHDAVKVVLVLK